MNSWIESERHLFTDTSCGIPAVHTIVPVASRGGNDWESALRTVSGRCTITPHAIQQCLARHPKGSQWGNDYLSAAQWMRRALCRGHLQRTFNHEDNLLPTFEVIDLKSDVVFRCQMTEKSAVIVTCFCRGVWYGAGSEVA